MIKLPMLVFAAVLLAAQSVPRVVLKPVDEAKTDPSLVEYRERLLGVARRRDFGGLSQLTLPTATLTPGVDGDQAQLRQAFFPNSVEWDDLLDLLQLGGSFVDRIEHPRFCAPYVYSQFPELWKLPEGYVGEVDPWVVTGSDVAARARPDLKAPVVTRLSHELVRYLGTVASDDYRPAWVEVLTPGGQRAYVHGSFIRAHDDHHACFEKFEDEWLMVEFYEGGGR